MGVGRDSSVGIATRYWLDGLGIESRWVARFSAPVQTGPRAHPASCTTGIGSFPGVKGPGCGVDHPPPFSAGAKERVELYLYSSSGPAWHVLRGNFTFTLQWDSSCSIRTGGQRDTDRHNEVDSRFTQVCERL